MPTINIPPKVRFVLYLIGALALLTVTYAVDKDWAGDAEVRYVTGIAALLQLLAAAKTSLSDSTATVTGTVVSETGETGAIEATIGTPGSEQHVTVNLTGDVSEVSEKMRRARDYGDGDPSRY
jgi:hypothetical protein